jgi:hypothetical protein
MKHFVTMFLEGSPFVHINAQIFKERCTFDRLFIDDESERWHCYVSMDPLPFHFGSVYHRGKAVIIRARSSAYKCV